MGRAWYSFSFSLSIKIEREFELISYNVNGLGDEKEKKKIFNYLKNEFLRQFNNIFAGNIYHSEN